jgi:hypothetical protein
MVPQCCAFAYIMGGGGGAQNAPVYSVSGIIVFVSVVLTSTASGPQLSPGSCCYRPVNLNSLWLHYMHWFYDSDTEHDSKAVIDRVATKLFRKRGEVWENHLQYMTKIRRPSKVSLAKFNCWLITIIIIFLISFGACSKSLLGFSARAPKLAEWTY